jgi:hypothetical protein
MAGLQKSGLNGGIRICHALPVALYLPMPKGHASDQQARVGERIVTRFIEIPRAAFASNRRQSLRSLTLAMANCRIFCLKAVGLIRW